MTMVGKVDGDASYFWHNLKPKVGDYHRSEAKKTRAKGEVGAILPRRRIEIKYGDVAKL